MNQTDLASSSSESHEEHIVELHQNLTIEMDKMIANCGDGIQSEKCCIYRVPATLRHLNEKAYTPTLVSIGPFHHGNKRLKEMEVHKQIMFKRLIGSNRSILDGLVALVKRLEPDVRASYSQTIDLTADKFTKLILLDAAFIIKLFNMHFSNEECEFQEDAKLSQIWLRNTIRRDLVLLENQLPFFIIENIFNELHHSPPSPSFRELTNKYFEGYNIQNLQLQYDVPIKHFTDLLRLFYLDEENPPQDKPSSNHLLSYNADAMHQAGIHFIKAESKCLLRLSVRSSILAKNNIFEIPTIEVDDGTEMLFRNMIALEQCYYPEKSYITDYVVLLDCLIDTYKDVDLLVDKDIIRNNMGLSRNVASLVNGLSKNVVVQDLFNEDYLKISEDLNAYCQSSCHKTMADLRRNYFNTPWRGAASFAGIALVLLTILQTILSVFQVVLAWK